MPTSTATDRAAPHNLEAERALLGSILLENEALPLALKVLGTQDFYSEAHRIIFSHMLALFQNKQVIELVTLTEVLQVDGVLEKAGGAAYISALSDGVPIGGTGAFPDYCRIVKAKSTTRHLINVSQNMLARAMEGTDDPEALLAMAKAQVADIEIEVKEARPPKAETPDEKKEKKRKEEERFYPEIPAAAWHSWAEAYRKAHEESTEGSDNWHWISFYTAIGALLGRTVGTRMGGMIHPNLYTVLVGVIGGDGKDTVADFALDFAQSVDGALYVPEGIDSKPGFCQGWQDYNTDKAIKENPRAIVRLPEISTLLSVAAQKGTQSVVPMLLTHYAPRPVLANQTVSSKSRIINPNLSMLACGARKYIGEIPEKDLISGLGRRVCFVGGDSKGPKPSPPPPDQQGVNFLIKTIREIIEFWQKRDSHALTLSPEAKKVWKDWYEKLYWRRKKGDELIPAMNNGDRVTCMKVALINAALDRSDRFIEPKHLEPALAFGEFLFDCRWPIFSEHGANPNLEIDKRILKRVPEPPSRIAKRDLQRTCHLDAETFNKRIHWLCMPGGELRERQVFRKTYVERIEE
jgi:hypothetical protein